MGIPTKDIIELNGVANKGLLQEEVKDSGSMDC